MTVLLSQDMLVVLEGSGLPAMVCVVLSDALAPTEAEIVTFVSSMNGTALGMLCVGLGMLCVGLGNLIGLSDVISWTMCRPVYSSTRPAPPPLCTD